jgi:hypothetical protein
MFFVMICKILVFFLMEYIHLYILQIFILLNKFCNKLADTEGHHGQLEGEHPLLLFI